MGVLFGQDLGPKFLTLALNEVASLHTVEVVLVGDLNQLVVALTPGALIGSESQVRVLVLTVLSNNSAVIELIVDQETLCVFAAIVDVDLGECVM